MWSAFFVSSKFTKIFNIFKNLLLSNKMESKIGTLVWSIVNHERLIMKSNVVYS